MSKQFKSPAVLSIGRLYCDLIFTGLDALPQLGREVFAGDMKIVAGGGAFISAAHFAHVGRSVALVARLGTDTLSQSLKQDLTVQGLDLRFLEVSDEAGPQVTVASVIGNDRAFLSRRAGTAHPSTLDEALSWKSAKHLHIAEYATLHEMPDLILKAKAAGLTVSLDPSWDETLIYSDDLLKKCEGVDIFLPNSEEAEAITGESDASRALDILSQNFPVVALKTGSEGAWVRVENTAIHLPAEKVKVVDTTGAGDAFNAGFIDFWIDGRSALESLEAGVQRGSLAVQALGGASILQS
jgi:sugar/nucleoside kinase (ribokinase family)